MRQDQDSATARRYREQTGTGNDKVSGAGNGRRDARDVFRVFCDIAAVRRVYTSGYDVSLRHRTGSHIVRTTRRFRHLRRRSVCTKLNHCLKLYNHCLEWDK